MSENMFVGPVNVCDSEIYLNLNTGDGVRDVFVAMEPIIEQLIHFGRNLHSDYPKDDIRQDICVSILEGMLKYDKYNYSKLSTFLFSVVKNKIIDNYRKRKIRRNVSYVGDMWDVLDGHLDPTQKIEVLQRTSSWDDKWKKIAFRVFVREESISSIAKEQGVSSWGLTRMMKKKFDKARKG